MEFIIEKLANEEWRNTRAWKFYTDDLPPGKYKVSIENDDQRTGQQNKWIHAILPEITIALRDLGWDDIKTTEDAKDFIKTMFFKKKITNGSEEVEVIQGTSKTSKLDFSEKAEEIIRWAAEYLGIVVAPPGEALKFEYD